MIGRTNYKPTPTRKIKIVKPRAPIIGRRPGNWASVPQLGGSTGHSHNGSHPHA